MAAGCCIHPKCISLASKAVTSELAIACACGSKDSDSKTCWKAFGMSDADKWTLRYVCSKYLENPMDKKFNPGWDGLKDGKPDTGEICYDDHGACVHVGKVCWGEPIQRIAFNEKVLSQGGRTSHYSTCCCLDNTRFRSQVSVRIVAPARRAMSAPGIACSFARFLAPERER